MLQAWYPGEEGGNAVADILFGNVSPSGKLCVSYPAVELHEPVCYNYGLENDPRIAWTFGYGLSYSSFEYSNMQMDQKVATVAESFNLSIDIKNTGKVDADEVVQIYVYPIDGKSYLKSIQLQGFARVSLKAGEKRTVKFRFFPEQIGYFDNGQWNIAPGLYMVKVAASSQNIRLEQEIVLSGNLHVKKLRNHYLSEVIKK